MAQPMNDCVASEAKGRGGNLGYILHLASSLTSEFLLRISAIYRSLMGLVRIGQGPMSRMDDV